MPAADENSQQALLEQLYRRNAELMTQVDQLSTLREVGLAISSTLELSRALPVIANVVQGALELRRLTIYEYRSDSGRLHPIIARYGNDLIGPERLAEDSVSRRGSDFGRALDSRGVVIREDALHCEAYVPLIARNEPLGVLLLQDRTDGAPFTDDDAVLFQQLGAQIAIALHNAQLYALAVTDGLTGLYVRRYFDLRLAEEFAAMQRYGRNFSLLLFDIDHFKNFNDTYGHQTGDLVLKQFAALLRDNTRSADICCRYGGEEIAVILPETKLSEALLLAEKLCRLIREHTFGDKGGKALHVTSSIGVAQCAPDLASGEEVVAAADAALYRAKQAGRDRIEPARAPRKRH